MVDINVNAQHVGLDTLRTAFEGSTDQQLRAKKGDGGVVNLYSTDHSKSGSIKASLSNRQGKFQRAERLVLQAFRNSTGVEPSDAVKDIVKADQTKVHGGTVKSMLDRVHTQCR